MEIEAHDVSVDGPHGPLLEPTSLRIGTGELVLVAGEPGRGHTALALALAGQLRPDRGTVLVDGAPAGRSLRRRVAVVDAPQVTEPDDSATLASIVAEELAMNGQPASRTAVSAWLTVRDAAEHAKVRLRGVPASVRTWMLAELAAARPGVELLVLDCPDRHTHDAQSWWAAANTIAQQHADRGLAVLVLCGTSSARLLDVPHHMLGTHQEKSL